MVCLSNEGTVVAMVRDTIGAASKRQATITLSPSKLVSTLFEEVGRDFQYQPDAFELIVQNNKTGDTTVLNNFKNKTLAEVRISFDQSIRNTLIISSIKNSKNMTLYVNDSNNEDDLSLGASASPTTGELPGGSNDPPPALMSIGYASYGFNRNRIPQIDTIPALDSCNYVGLVNQAMTCYLNSLLQALYMTPEFRNALYNWEFDGQNKATSIPFQLQKLFLNLQTSTKSAVETTELTKSFGWDLSEAWQQHDIQELCRVMFDALEQKFKDTEQANLINALYEGKMLDYVKCLECSTEKSREDTFLDIPLPVRPFGSSVAYNSIEEALRAFVLPETLDGTNQYFCEKCNKKCDAHKGLKFTKFPYLLTLHLKRFDFDYSTMHRIKLNDKVVFPEILNLNSFIANANSAPENEAMEERETIVKCDDSSTTDSGSALDDESCQGTDISSTVNGPDDNCQDDDEGIDVSSGNNHEHEKNRHQEAKGPYIYELFSIMIHSGSASGGHYYAYIKDFRKNQWFCFNDQTVTRITEDDIKKTYGGGPTRGYYSGAYSSSTNAYMLMYRQIDKERNCNAMTADEFPPHIKKLLQQMREKEEYDRAAKERENEMFRLKVFCWHPVQNQLVDTKVYCMVDTKLSEAASEAYQNLKLESIVPFEDCRLVTFNKMQESIECSFEEDLKFCDIPSRSMHHSDNWLLDIRQPGTEFQIYKPGGVTMKVFLINLEEEEVDGSMNFRVHAGDTVRDVKMRLSKMLNINVNTIKLVLETYSNEPHYLDQDDVPMKFDPSCGGYKLYVSNALDEDFEKPFSESKLHKVIDRFVHVVTISATLPDTDISTLESLSIPPLDLNQNSEKLDMAAGGDGSNISPNITSSPQLGSGAVCETYGDQSNSEDSSLSDSDRTLVGEAPGDCIGLLSSSSNSPADQHMSSPNDPAEDLYNHEIFSHPTEEMNWDDEDVPEMSQYANNYYFKATVNSNSGEDLYNDQDSRWCTIQVDKRMSLARFKKNMEPIVGVPIEYFKVFRQYPNEVEWSRLSDTLSSLKDGDRLILKLGRVLKKDEFGGKVYRLTPENSEPFDFLFEWVVAKGQTVGSVKKEILFAAKKQHMLDINYHTCRLRKKNWKSPCKVFLDDQKFGEDIPIANNWEMFLQDLGEPENVKSSDQLCLFVKRWCPSTLTLTPFHEVVLDVPTMDELKAKLSEESQIPKEFIEVGHPKVYFPCDMNILDIHTEVEWNPNVTLLEKWPVQVNEDGSVFYYRDSRETLKEITQEERNEINKRENARLGKFSTKSYSPRRERALKIYLDASNKSEEPCVD